VPLKKEVGIERASYKGGGALGVFKSPRSFPCILSWGVGGAYWQEGRMAKGIRALKILLQGHHQGY